MQHPSESGQAAPIHAPFRPLHECRVAGGQVDEGDGHVGGPPYQRFIHLLSPGIHIGVVSEHGRVHRAGQHQIDADAKRVALNGSEFKAALAAA